jgi:hypothetical protein
MGQVRYRPDWVDSDEQDDFHNRVPGNNPAHAPSAGSPRFVSRALCR